MGLEDVLTNSAVTSDRTIEDRTISSLVRSDRVHFLSSDFDSVSTLVYCSGNTIPIWHFMDAQ